MALKTYRSRFLTLFLVGLFITIACSYALHVQTVNATTTKPKFTNAHDTLLPIQPNNSSELKRQNPLFGLPPAVYDEQLGLTFTQSFVSLAYNVTAIPQNDTNGYGPAYLLNGLSDDGYWYQIGLAYNWPYTDLFGGGGYNQGFNLVYEVFNSVGESIYPTNGGGGIESFSGTVNSDDLVLLNLYVSYGGAVTFYALDWNTNATAFQTYTDSQTKEFIGLSEPASNGFFTGLMTEWWHANPYSGDEQTVNYTDNSFALSSAWPWMDEWEPGNPNWAGAWSTSTPTAISFLSNPTQLHYLSYNGATEYGSAYQFITGSMQEPTTITLLPANIANPISNSDYFEVTYTVYGQNQTMSAQASSWLLTDVGSNVIISGNSAGSSSTEEWVLNGFNQPAIVPAGSSLTYYYYDLLSQQVAYSADSNAINPYVTYITAPTFLWGPSTAPSPSAVTSLLPYSQQQTIWVQRGTTVTVNSTIAGTAQDQWAAQTSSWTISQANQIYADIFYYHQYRVTARYATADNSVPSSSPLLTGTRFGSSFQIPLTTSNQTAWLDKNTQWSLTNVTALSGTERWICSTGNSGTMTQAIVINPTYAHQYYLTVTSPAPVNIPTTGSGWHNAGTMADFGVTSTVSVAPGEQYAFASWTGSGSGSYSGSDANGSCTMNAPVTEVASWNTQYYLTVTSSYGSPMGAGWYNSGATATFNVTTPFSGGTGIQYLLNSWTGTGTGSYSGSATSDSVIMNNAITEAASWTTQYQVTFTVTPSGGATTNPSGSNLWENAGPLSISASPNSGYTFSQWTASGSITLNSASSASTTANVNGPGTITASLTQTSSQTSSSNTAPTNAPTQAPTQTPKPSPFQSASPTPEPTPEFPSVLSAVVILVIMFAATSLCLRKASKKL